MSNENGVNLIGSPVGTLDVISEAIRAFQKGTDNDPGSHTVLAISEEGPIFIVGPKTGGIVVLELSEVEGSQGQYIAEDMANQNLGFDVRNIRLPLDMVKRMNWQLLDSDKATPLPAYYYVANLDADKRLQPYQKVQRSPIIGTIKHVPRIDDERLKKYCLAIYDAYRTGAQQAGVKSGKILVSDIRVSDVGLMGPTDMLPALIVHSILNWFPVVQATGYGFSALLIEDDDATLGYRLGSLGLKNPLYLRLAIVETVRTLEQSGDIDLTPSIKKLRGWLARNGYNTDRIDTLMADNYY